MLDAGNVGPKRLERSAVRNLRGQVDFRVGSPAVQLTMLILLFSCSCILSNGSWANTPERLCVSRKVPNPVMLLLHKPSHKLHVIKSGRKIKSINLSKSGFVPSYPAGVYVILKEKASSKFARWSFAPTKARYQTLWKGRALSTEATVAKLQRWQGVFVPPQHAQDLLRITRPGAILVVADSHSSLGEFESIELFDEAELGAAVAKSCEISVTMWQPTVKKLPDEPISIVVSERDSRVYVFEGNELLESFHAKVAYPHRETGRHVYIAIKPLSKAEDRRWLALSLAGGGHVRAPPVRQAKDVLDRFAFEEAAQSMIDDHFNRGVVLVVSERSVRAIGLEDDLITLMHSDHSQLE